MKAALAKNPKATAFEITGDIERPDLKHGKDGGRASFLAGPFDLNGVLQFSTSPADAPVIRLGGPLEITFYSRLPRLFAGCDREFDLVVGTPGIGPGTFAMLRYQDTIPASIKPNVEILYTRAAPGVPRRKQSCALGERCCLVNLYGMVHVPADAGAGTATVRLTLEDWKGVTVASATHTLTVAVKALPKAEPVAANLIATLRQKNPHGSSNDLKFSADSKRLFVTGYPSGIVQVFEVSSFKWGDPPAGSPRAPLQFKELQRIETPAGLRGTWHYAFLTPDWKTLYVNVEKSSVKRIVRDGQKVTLVEYSGAIRVWDMETGRELGPLKPPKGMAPVDAYLAPDGRSLVCVERPSYQSGLPVPKDVTVIWDLKTRTRCKIADGYQSPAFAPDGKTMALCCTDYGAKTSVVRLLDAATFQEIARIDCPEKDRHFFLDRFSPDGSVVAISLSGKMGGKREVWFRDAKTLADRGRYVGAVDPEGADGTTAPSLQTANTTSFWDLAARSRCGISPRRRWFAASA